MGNNIMGYFAIGAGVLILFGLLGVILFLQLRIWRDRASIETLRHEVNSRLSVISIATSDHFAGVSNMVNQHLTELRDTQNGLYRLERMHQLTRAALKNQHTLMCTLQNVEGLLGRMLKKYKSEWYIEFQSEVEAVCNISMLFANESLIVAGVEGEANLYVIAHHFNPNGYWEVTLYLDEMDDKEPAAVGHLDVKGNAVIKFEPVQNSGYDIQILTGHEDVAKDKVLH